LGWTPEVGLVEGVQRTYEWFLTHISELRTK
jgi:nucleoside-diphosphate-sugar epimerase